MVVRIVFLGTPDFAVPSLQALLKIRSQKTMEFQVAGVITQPDRPSGRGLRRLPPPVKRVAVEAGIPVYQPESLRRDRAGLQLVRTLNPQLMVVVAFGQILPVEFFDFPRYGTVNVHASLLPKFRGAAPIVHALLQGERETGVTIMKIDEGMDTGDILSARKASVDEEITAGELESQLSRLGAELLLETIPPYLSGDLKPRPQDPALATDAPRISKKDAKIDWDGPARSIHNRIRAFNPRPVAFTLLGERPVKLWKSRLLPSQTGKEQSCGTILEIAPDGLVVQCAKRTVLALLELQLPGQRRLPAADFANGAHLQVGDRFR